MNRSLVRVFFFTIMMPRMLVAALLHGVVVEGAKPNIVWIMADDLGFGEIGSFPGGSVHGRILTPHIDRLAASGMKFTRSYAGYTVCAPSRTTLLTGFHSGHFEGLQLSGQDIEPGQLPTVAEVLKGAGYATALFGKAAPLSDPERSGFDDFLGQVDQGACHDMYPAACDAGARPSTRGGAGLAENPGWSNVVLGNANASRDACMARPEAFNYTTDVFHAAAMSWLRKRKERPFFLYLSFTTPHAGGWGPGNAEAGNPTPSTFSYDEARAWPDVERDHAGAITYLDAKIGELVDYVADHHPHTLVLFASDNGAHSEGGHDHTFFNSTGGLRGFKRSLYEGGVRSPTIARWPGVVPSGSESAHLWSFADFLATAADLAGADPPKTDGVSIAPTLRGEAGDQKAHDFLYWTWVGDGRHAYGYAATAGDYKVVYRNCTAGGPRADDALELYELDADPFETDDVAASQPGVVAHFQSLLTSANLSCKCYQC